MALIVAVPTKELLLLFGQFAWMGGAWGRWDLGPPISDTLTPWFGSHCGAPAFAEGAIPGIESGSGEITT